MQESNNTQAFPKISIIIPSYNQGQYIEQTICSIISQNYPNLELIVIDGSSTDSTINILKKYSPQIHYWVSEPDKGQAHAINKGLVRATGDIINWINSDDYLEPGSLYTIGAFFRNNPEKNVLCGLTRCFFDNDNTTSHIYRMGIGRNVSDTILQLEMNQPGTFYRTKVFKELGGVNDSLTYVFDNEFWIKFLCKYGLSGIGTTSHGLAQFRLHNDSKSVNDGHKFDEEQNSVMLALAKQLQLPSYILAKLGEERRILYYKQAEFEVSHLDKNKFKAYYSIKYLRRWYHENKLDIARDALLNVLKYDIKLYPLNRMYISMLLKLMAKF